MPLLMCPNDNSSMQTVNRAGVEFDMCPACRGVWLDRGELEKVMASVREETAPAASPPVRTEPRYEEQPRRYEEPRHADPRHGDPRHGFPSDRRWEDDRYRHKKRKGFELFDIFD